MKLKVLDGSTKHLTTHPHRFDFLSMKCIPSGLQDVFWSSPWPPCLLMFAISVLWSGEVKLCGFMFVLSQLCFYLCILLSYHAKIMQDGCSVCAIMSTNCVSCIWLGSHTEIEASFAERRSQDGVKQQQQKHLITSSATNYTEQERVKVCLCSPFYFNLHYHEPGAGKTRTFIQICVCGNVIFWSFLLGRW